MITNETIRDYLDRSGDEKLLFGYVETNDNDSFMIWNVIDDALVILNCYGDGEYWDKWAANKARQLDLTKVRFGTRRNPKSFERKFGYKTVGYIMEKEV